MVNLSYIKELTRCLVVNHVPLVSSLNLILPVYEILDDDDRYEYSRWLTTIYVNSKSG